MSPGRAALALAGLLVWLALPRAAPRLAPCPEPAERVDGAGHTLAVACDGGPPLRGPARRLFGLPLDPNREDAAALETLPGIGPARAAAIVRERLRRPFATVAELCRVPGIGPRTLARIAPWLAVAEEPPDPAAEKFFRESGIPVPPRDSPLRRRAEGSQALSKACEFQ